MRLGRPRELSVGLGCHCPRLLWGLQEEALFFPDDVAKTGGLAVLSASGTEN